MSGEHDIWGELGKFFFSFMHSSCSTSHQKWCFVKNQWTIHWILYCIQNNIPLCGVIHVVHRASKLFLIIWNMGGLSVIITSLCLTKIQMIRSTIISLNLHCVVYSNSTYLNNLLPELEVKSVLLFHWIYSLALFLWYVFCGMLFMVC